MAVEQYLVGIDEAGRGPIAGPVAVGAVWSRSRAALAEMLAFFPKNELRDSKKLTEKQREKIFATIQEWKKLERLDFAVTLVSNQVIDERGITVAIKTGVRECLSKADLVPEYCQVKLDGNLTAPREYLEQETIVRGDESELVIALASICAKVVRDKWMLELDKKYPDYGLAKHKGYGTAAHYAALARHGLSPIHRKSFLKNLPKK